jgi:nicotinamidase-related amidase
MAFTESDSVVVALHLQNEVLHPDGKIRFGFAEGAAGRDSVIRAARTVLGGARRHGVPVVSVRIAFRPDFKDVIANCEIFRRVGASKAMAEGSWGAAFYDGLGPLPDEFVVHHTRINGFYGSALEEALCHFRPRTLVMLGIATNYVVEHTARHACDMGYRVVVVRDACSAATAEAHEASLRALAVLADIRTARQVARGFAASKVGRGRGAR